MSKRTDKQREAKAQRKAAYGIKANRSEAEKKQLNLSVPYQRRKAERLRGAPMAARSIAPWWMRMSPKMDMFALDKLPWAVQQKMRMEKAKQEASAGKFKPHSILERS